MKLILLFTLLILNACKLSEKYSFSNENLPLAIHSSYQESATPLAPYSNQLVITGEGLAGIKQITVDLKNCSVTSQQTEKIHCLAPSLPKGFYDVRILYGDNKIQTIKNGYISGADLVGSQNFWSTPGKTQFASKTLAFHIMSTGEYVTFDDENKRMLIWNSFPTHWSTPFDRVIFRNSSRYSLVYNSHTEPWFPGRTSGMCEYRGKLAIPDEINHRILIYNHLPQKWDQKPDLVLGQINDTQSGALNPPTASSLNAPKELWCDNQVLVVADHENHRVLIWKNEITQNNQPADIVLGQADFITRPPIGTPSALNMNKPAGVFVDDQDRLFVVDNGNNRILIYLNFSSLTSNAPADFVIGQNDFTTKTTTVFSQPRGMLVHNNHLIVTNQSNHAIDFFDLSDLGIGSDYKNRYRRIGGFGTSGDRSLNFAHFMRKHNNQLIVSDFTNHRVLIWNDIDVLTTKNTAIPYNDPAQNIPADSFLHQRSFEQVLAAPELITDYSTINLRAGMMIGADLFVFDYSNRVLVINNYQSGDKVYEQNLIQDNVADTSPGIGPFKTNNIISAKHFPNFNQTFIVDTANDRILIYNGGMKSPTSVHVLGQDNLNSGTNYLNNVANRTSRLRDPVDVCRTNNLIFVSDTVNHRVVAYSSTINVDDTDPMNPTFSNSILFAVGQPTNSDNTLRAASNRDLNQPKGIWCDETRLLVADQMNNRILEFSPLPNQDYPEASRVIGQKDFSSVSDDLLFKPRYLDSDGTNIIVSLPEHHKVLYWNNWPDQPLKKADYVFGQRDPEGKLPYCGQASQSTDINCFHTPLQISQNATSIFIADGLAGRLLIFPRLQE